MPRNAHEAKKWNMRYGNDSSGQGMDHVAEVKMWPIAGTCDLRLEHVANR